MRHLPARSIETVLSLATVALVVFSLLQIFNSARVNESKFDGRLNAYNQFMRLALLFSTPESCQRTLGPIFTQVKDALTFSDIELDKVAALAPPYEGHEKVSLRLHQTAPGRAQVIIAIGELRRSVPLDFTQGSCAVDISAARYQLGASLRIGSDCVTPWRQGYGLLCSVGKMLILETIPTQKFACCPVRT